MINLDQLLSHDHSKNCCLKESLEIKLDALRRRSIHQKGLFLRVRALNV